jgi:3-oxoacyl-[acyl-carrier protein] reductase
MGSLNGKVALITGASRGIGRAAAVALSKAGAKVLAHYSQAAGDAESLVRSLRSAGGEAEMLGADLSQSDGPHRLAEQVRQHVGSRLDILIPNAGVSIAAPITEATIQDFDRMYAVNVRAPYFLVQQLLPLLGDGSSIIFTSSLAARAAVRNLSAYASTKGAIATLVKQLATELGPRNIRVNAVAPGVVETDMSNFTKTEAGRTVTLGMQSLQRIAQPEDIGDAFEFLASERAHWITGDTLSVDGGSKL